jgi:glycosyltransferase involved in cell wall biosynthesis
MMLTFAGLVGQDPQMTRKIKVLMVGTLPVDLESVKGGVEAAILNLFSGFSKLAEVDVVHISFVEDIKEQTVIRFSENVKIRFVPFKVKIRLLDYLLNASVLKQIIREEAPDVIHIQESEPHLLRFLFIPKQNVVVTQHGIMREELKYASGVKNKLKFVFKASVERFVFPLFRNVVFISAYNRKLFQGKLHLSANIYNAVNPIFFTHKPASLPARNAIIYVGVLSHRKNLRLIIEALQVLKRRDIYFTLHVVGWYKENDLRYEIDMIELVKRYGLGKQIKFHGWLKQRDILQVFDQCSVFVLPSLQETLPVSIAEAMALGKVVMATDVGAISEMFHDGETGYLIKRNGLAELVTLLHTHYHQYYDTTSEKIQLEAVEKYHPEANARRTVEFYQQVIKK